MVDFAGNRVGTLHYRRFPDGSDSDTEAAVAAAVSGDLAAFETLYREFAPRVYGLCLRLTGQREAAEDCTQESFVAAWRGLGRFEKRSRFSTWLQRIAIRTVLSRRRGLRDAHEVGEPAAGLPDRPDPGTGAPPLDLERAIAALPEGARDVLVLVGIYGYSHARGGERARSGGRHLQGSIASRARFAQRGARIGGVMKDTAVSPWMSELAKLLAGIVPPAGSCWPADRAPDRAAAARGTLQAVLAVAGRGRRPDDLQGAVAVGGAGRPRSLRRTRAGASPTHIAMSLRRAAATPAISPRVPASSRHLQSAARHARSGHARARSRRISP